ncbi:MAG: hypothetical protein ABH869_01025 [Candidatus Omnitrophota bacterium]
MFKKVLVLVVSFLLISQNIPCFSSPISAHSQQNVQITTLFNLADQEDAYTVALAKYFFVFLDKLDTTLQGADFKNVEKLIKARVEQFQDGAKTLIKHERETKKGIVEKNLPMIKVDESAGELLVIMSDYIVRYYNPKTSKKDQILGEETFKEYSYKVSEEDDINGRLRKQILQRGKEPVLVKLLMEMQDKKERDVTIDEIAQLLLSRNEQEYVLSLMLYILNAIEEVGEDFVDDKVNRIYEQADNIIKTVEKKLLDTKDIKKKIKNESNIREMYRHNYPFIRRKADVDGNLNEIVIHVGEYALRYYNGQTAYAKYELEDPEDSKNAEPVFYSAVQEGPVDGALRVQLLKVEDDADASPAETPIISAVNARNEQNKSNYPSDIKREDPYLFFRLRELRMPIYSQKDDTYYVWDNDSVEKVVKMRHDMGDNDEKLPPVIQIDEMGNVKDRVKEETPLYDINFRADRQKQWVGVILEKSLTPFKVAYQILKAVLVVTTQYLPIVNSENVILEKTKVENGLVEVLTREGIYVKYVFDAEKGKFIPAFRGGQEEPFDKELEDLEFGSISMPVLMTEEQCNKHDPAVKMRLKDKYIGWFYGDVPKGLKQIPNKEYRKYPGLSMFVLARATATKIREAKEGTFGLTNLDGPDLIGHVAGKDVEKITDLFVETEEGKFELKQGNGWDCVLECLKIADAGLNLMMKEVEDKEGVFILVGDHGSVDDMRFPNHSANDVPIFIIDYENEDIKLVKSTGSQKDTQADVAVTILHVLGIDKPTEMTGKSLLPEDYKGRKDRIVWQVILDGFGHTDLDPEQNAFLRAREKGITPTIKKLYDMKNYVLLKAAGMYAGLRGGWVEEIYEMNQQAKKEGGVQYDPLKRKAMITQLESTQDNYWKKIKIVNYDYRDIPQAQLLCSYENGLDILKRSSLLQDKMFLVNYDQEHFMTKDIPDRTVEVVCLDLRQIGSTEYNTWTLGAGRIVEQSIRRIDKRWLNGTMLKSKALQNFTKHAKQEGYAHIVGILQEAGVHASARQLYWLIEHLKRNGVNRFVLDLATDGRDEGGRDSLIRIKELRAALKFYGIQDKDYVLNLRGREICFDRAKNWNLTEAWINELVWGSRIDKSIGAGYITKELILNSYEKGKELWEKMIEKRWLVKVNDEEAKIQDKEWREDGDFGGGLDEYKNSIEGILKQSRFKKLLDNEGIVANILRNAFSALNENQEKQILAFDLELGNKKAGRLIKQLVQAIEEMKQDNILNKILKNIEIIKVNGAELGNRLDILTKSETGIKKENIIIIAKKTNKNYFTGYDSVSTIAYIDDSELSKEDLLPLPEITLFAIAKHLGWSADKLEHLYACILNAESVNSLAEFTEKFGKDKTSFIVKIIPKAVRFDMQELKEVVDQMVRILKYA